MWLGAIVLYLRATRSMGRAGRIALWTGAALLTFIWYDNIAGLPHGVHPDPLGSLLVFALFIAWAYWVDGARPRLPCFLRHSRPRVTFRRCREGGRRSA
jgi:hypothetical protein